MCEWDWISLEWFFFLCAESVVKGFGLLPAVNQVLSLRTWTLCACLPELHLRASHFSSELSRTSSPTVTIAPVVAVMFTVSQESSRSFYHHSEASRTAFSWSWRLKETGTKVDLDLSGKRILRFGFGIFKASCLLFFPTNFACILVPLPHQH